MIRGLDNLDNLKRVNRISIRPPAMSTQFETVKVQMKKTTMASYIPPTQQGSGS